MRRPRSGGFTLVEVMLALAILGLSLVILVRSVAGNITAAQDSFYMGVATDLARGKMFDIEEHLLQEGFQETEEEEDGDFSDEGWPNIKWKYLIEPVELPDLETLMNLSQEQGGEGQGTGAEGEGEEATSDLDKFQSSALGGMLGMLGMGGASTESGGSASQTAGFLQMGYPMVQQVLKASVRKISLTIDYDTGVHKETFKVILYVTDPAGMQKAMGALGADQ
ncbi:MAG: type II secretion system GspH family protein [Deltaproteobacteria bacterium]|nr:type II secretion system GspH family protein [Kofleriaceae bacterium]